MKQVVQNYKSGELALLDVPAPAVKPGGILVRTAFSLISTGTELMKVSEASMSMLGKARSRPDQVAKVMQSVATNGLSATYRKVINRLDSYTPLGYSLCGVVEEVGAGITDVAAGDLVACAGNEHALHAELNWVPKNLYCRVPPGVAPQHAAFGTVGAIAMQGVRRGEPQLGETALVIGLGLIGQLVVQLLQASGVRVVGVDPDAGRCELAQRLEVPVIVSGGLRDAEAARRAYRESGADAVMLARGDLGVEIPKILRVDLILERRHLVRRLFGIVGRDLVVAIDDRLLLRDAFHGIAEHILLRIELGLLWEISDSDALGRPGLGRSQLDLEPAGKPALLRPDALHGGSGVAGDHTGKSSERAGYSSAPGRPGVPG